MAGERGEEVHLSLSLLIFNYFVEEGTIALTMFLFLSTTRRGASQLQWENGSQQDLQMRLGLQEILKQKYFCFLLNRVTL